MATVKVMFYDTGEWREFETSDEVNGPRIPGYRLSRMPNPNSKLGYDFIAKKVTS